MKVFILIAIIGLQTFNLRAGNQTELDGSRASAMGNTSVCLKDLWSAGNNQAGLASIESPSIGINYSNKYLLKGTDLKGIVFAYPLMSGVFGLSAAMFGSNLFNQKNVGLAYARNFGNISAGFQFNYLSTHISEDYGSKGIFNLEAGIQIKFLKNIILGAHVYNPTRSKLAAYNDERISSIYKSGISWSPSDKVIICTEIEKDLNMPSVFKFGIEYKPLKQISLRSGFCSTSSLANFGFGLNLDHFIIDIASSFHPVLGYSPMLSISYIF